MPSTVAEIGGHLDVEQMEGPQALFVGVVGIDGDVVYELGE